MKKLALTLLLAFGCVQLFGQKVYNVQKNTAERKTLLDIARKPIEKELGQSIKFVCSTFKSNGEWAFVSGQMQQPNGKEIDVKKFDKVYRQQAEDGLFDNNFQVLFRKKANQWTIVQRAIGCTDVCWAGWWEESKAPRGVFPL
jgi:hypothetical protein